MSYNQSYGGGSNGYSNGNSYGGGGYGDNGYRNGGGGYKRKGDGDFGGNLKQQSWNVADLAKFEKDFYFVRCFRRTIEGVMKNWSCI